MRKGGRRKRHLPPCYNSHIAPENDYAPRPKTQDPRPKTQDPRPKTQDPRPKTQDPRPKTQDPRPKTQNPKPKLQDLSSKTKTNPILEPTMSIRHFAGIFVAIALICPFAQAAGTVQLELVGKSSAAAAFQEWGKALDKAGIPNVRIRSGSDEELKIGIETAGTPDRPVYNITGVLVSREEISLPGGRYKRSEIGRLKAWMDDLAQNGLPSQRPAKVAFGLTQPQYDEVRKALAKPVRFATQGVARNEAVDKIARQLSIPLKFADGSLGEVGGDKVEDELTDLTCGTALAALLRPAGYCLIPKNSGGTLELTAVKSRPELKEIWPVGKTPEKRVQEILPKMMEFLPVNVQNVSAATAAAAIGKRLATPLLYDRVALARYGIDPAKAMVALPRSQTTYSLALRKLLFQADLKFEVRVDESDAPFLWISTVKPL